MRITVNGKAVAEGMVQRELESARRVHPEWTEAQAGERARESAIEWTLIREQAGQFGGPAPAEAVEAEFQNLVEPHGGKPAFFQAHGLKAADEQRIRGDIEQQLRVTRFLEDLTRHVRPPTAEELAAYYEEHQADFIAPEQVHVAHIVRRPRDAAAAVRALTELSALRRRLLAGEDFLKTAAQEAGGAGASPDLGFFARGQMAPEVEAVVFSMNAGEISPVFQTSFGYHIATVLERTAPRQRTLDECRAEILDQLHTDAKNDSIGRWVDAQKSVARIVLQE
ncbi:MAG: peptidylprolyl isomerase [Kiritimatiellaeota bacterium]|nr:peptidylprolyl isomerase [Kiritimatiellota bacterium]